MIKLLTEHSSLEDWLTAADYIAKEYYGGHFTMLAFTFSYKFTFGTITDREEINDLDPYDNLKDAIMNAVTRHNTNKKEVNNKFIPFKKNNTYITNN